MEGWQREGPPDPLRAPPTPGPGPGGIPGCGVAQGALQAVATAAAGLTPLASILLRRPGVPHPPPLGPAGGPGPSQAERCPGPPQRRPLAAPHRARAAQSRKPSAGWGWGGERWRPP